MRFDRRLVRQAVVVPLCCAGALLLGPWSAFGALPDGRQYTLVSPTDKNHGAILHAALSEDGDRVQYQLIGGLDGGAINSPFLARWTGSGWVSNSLLPPYGERPFPTYSIEARTPDLTKFFAAATEGIPGGVQSPTALLALSDSGTQIALASIDAANLRGTANLVASSDGQHVFASLRQPIDPAHTPGTWNVYDLVGTPTLVSRLPDESVPTCGVAFSPDTGFASQTANSTSMQHWASTAGDRVFFLSRGNDPACLAPRELYERDLSGPTPVTRLISGPAIAGDADATFLQASRDGSEVVYETSAQLAADDTNGDPDVYRYVLGQGNECLTCATADADIEPASTTAAFNASIMASEDLSHVYFVSQRQLAPGSAAGADNLYVWRVTASSGPQGAISYVAPAPPVPNGTGFFVANDPLGTLQITPDGNTLVFASDLPAMDALANRGNGGFFEYYRYDDRSGETSCISCPPASPPAAGATTLLAVPFANVDYARIMSDDGRRVFFMTSDALVPGDVNGARDIYEWNDGHVDLISDGVSTPSPVNADLLEGVTSDGSDVVFRSYARLTPDAVDGAAQLYDARVGAPQPVWPAPTAPCNGEQCQGPVVPNPAFAAPGSESFLGAGNVRAVTRPKVSVIAHTAGGSRALLTLRVSAKGVLALSGRHVKAVRRSVSRAAAVRMRLLLDRGATRALKRGRRVKTTVTVTFTADSGTARTGITLTFGERRHARSSGNDRAAIRGGRA